MIRIAFHSKYPIKTSFDKLERDNPPSSYSYRYQKSDYDRDSLCNVEDCEQCNFLCDSGLIISCDRCGDIHHTDWLGWQGKLDESGRCFVFCEKCFN